ncbi:MAG: hypothetical protein BWX84_00045 [Verrucomicrobia bacterium ADurb.Bin118]|nr:MAG: hypothetical protein BWX84_00045 [Verrucomicrobia bacterium ADurb.Bin118]
MPMPPRGRGFVRARGYDLTRFLFRCHPCFCCLFCSRRSPGGVLGGLARTVEVLGSAEAKDRADMLGVMVGMWLHADSRGLCYPGLVRLCRYTGRGKKRVIWALKELEGLGVLRRVVEKSASKKGQNLQYQKYRIRPLYRLFGVSVVVSGGHRGVVSVGHHNNMYQEEQEQFDSLRSSQEIVPSTVQGEGGMREVGRLMGMGHRAAVKAAAGIWDERKRRVVGERAAGKAIDAELARLDKEKGDVS